MYLVTTINRADGALLQIHSSGDLTIAETGEIVARGDCPGGTDRCVTKGCGGCIEGDIKTPYYGYFISSGCSLYPDYDTVSLTFPAGPPPCSPDYEGCIGCYPVKGHPECEPCIAEQSRKHFGF